MTTTFFSVDSDAPVRDKLLAKAKEFIVENGIQNLSHERLAKACGISKGACLHYFPSKAALWDKLIEDFVAHLDSQSINICSTMKMLALKTRCYVPIAIGLMNSEPTTTNPGAISVTNS